MGFADLFNWATSTPSAITIPSLFPLGIAEEKFVRTEVIHIYTKILTDVAERTEGLTADQQVSLWDNCVASEASEGLITLVAKAMYDKSELFLVLDKATKVLRPAIEEEKRQIRDDYKKSGESKAGTYISFRNYATTDMVKIYSSLEFTTVGALNKTMNVSKAVQIKINDLRKSVSAGDSAVAELQIQAMVDALKVGRDVYMDGKDVLECANPNLEPTKAAMNLLNEKKSFYLNLPASYITGVLNSGLGDSGAGDARAIDRGLKGFFFQIFKPICKALFNKDVTFKSEDYAQLSTTLEALKTFDLVSEEFLSNENKLKIVNKLFGLPDDTKGEAPKALPAPTVDKSVGNVEKVPVRVPAIREA